MQGIVHGNGYHIVPQGRDGLKYVEGDLEVYVDGEIGLGDPDFVVYAQCMHLWGDQRKPLADSERLRVLDNIALAFRQAGLKVEFE